MSTINLDNIKPDRIYELDLIDEVYYLIKIDNKIFKLSNNNRNCYELILLDNLKFKNSHIKEFKYRMIDVIKLKDSSIIHLELNEKIYVLFSRVIYY